MKDVKEAIKILREEGYTIPNNVARYYKNTDTWRKWWEGFVSSFHNHEVGTADGTLTTLRRYSLGMAKTVSEDWANLLLNEKTFIDVKDDATQKYLSGDKETQEGGLLNRVDFWTKGNIQVENAYATGTSAIIIGVENASAIDNDETLEVSSGEIVYRYIDDPQCIIPFSWNDTEIVDCAFMDDYYENGMRMMHIQIHEKEETKYKVTNLLYKLNRNKWEKDTYEGAEAYRSPAKMFHIMKPNLSNNIDGSVPFGISVFANATDQLMGIDLAIDNLGMDFLLGRKKVFMEQDMMVTFTDKEGKPRVHTGATIEQTLFHSMGAKKLSDKPSYQEYNPALRVEENKAGIQTQLDLLSLKVGMGTNRYSFENGMVYTNVTQTKNSNKDLYESVNKQRVAITSFLKGLIKNTLIVAKSVGEPVNPEALITVRFDDSAFTDEETERMRFLQEIREGVRQKWEYRVKYLSESEEEAKAMVAEEELDLTGAFS